MVPVHREEAGMVHKVLAWILVVALTLPASLMSCVSRHVEQADSRLCEAAS